jgi:peroxiredoxin
VLPQFRPAYPAYIALGYPNRLKDSAEHWLLPLPATYIIDRNGLVVLSYIDADYTTRLEPAEIIVALTHLRARRNPSRRV